MSGARARAAEEPASDIAEAYRVLRASVKFATGEAPVRSVLVVDIDRDEPSGVAERLAQAFAAAGDRCLLIETNARDGSGREPGFLDLVAGTAQAGASEAGDAVGGLARMGPGSPARPDLLSSNRAGEVVAQLAAGYDIVVLAAAPLPAFGDAIALAPRVDATVLVVTSGRTRRPRAVEAREALERVGARLLGVVMVETRRRRFW